MFILSFKVTYNAFNIDMLPEHSLRIKPTALVWQAPFTTSWATEIFWSKAVNRCFRGDFSLGDLIPSVLHWHCHHACAYMLQTKALHRNHFAQSNGERKTIGRVKLLISPSLMAWWLYSAWRITEFKWCQCFNVSGWENVKVSDNKLQESFKGPVLIFLKDRLKEMQYNVHMPLNVIEGPLRLQNRCAK